MTFSEKLRELRGDQTQDAVATVAGMPVGTLRHLEQGRRSPSWKNVVRIARALGHTSAVFDECDEVQPEPPEKPAPSAKRGRPKSDEVERRKKKD